MLALERIREPGNSEPPHRDLGRQEHDCEIRRQRRAVFLGDVAGIGLMRPARVEIELFRVTPRAASSFS